MSGNGKYSQPSIPAVQLPEPASLAQIQEDVRALQGVMEHVAAKTEYLSHCFDRLGDAVVLTRKDVQDLRENVAALAGPIGQIPAIKELLVEALTK